MPNSSSVLPWTLTMPAGSLQEWEIGFTTSGSSGPVGPYPISGHTWEYVVRTSPADNGTPLIDITTSGNSQGILIVTASTTLSQVLITLYPAATQGLAAGQYFHTLWQDPGTSAAYTWFTGNLVIDGNPQP